MQIARTLLAPNSAERFRFKASMGGPGGAHAAHPGQAETGRLRRVHQQHARALLGHPPRCSPRRQEVRSHVQSDRRDEGVYRQLRDRNALGPRLRDRRDGVERNVEPARRLEDLGDVAFDGRFVQSVDQEGLRRSARRDDLLGHALDFAERPAGEEDPRAFASEDPGYGAANSPTGAIDDRRFVLEKHSLSLHLTVGEGGGRLGAPPSVRVVETMGVRESHRPRRKLARGTARKAPDLTELSGEPPCRRPESFGSCTAPTLADKTQRIASKPDRLCHAGAACWIWVGAVAGGIRKISYAGTVSLTDRE